MIPIVAVAVGMGLSNGPASAASTACVSPEPDRLRVRHLEHGAIRRFVRVRRAGRVDLRGVAQLRVDDGRELSDALASGLAWSCVVLAITCALGVGMGLIGRYRQTQSRRIDAAAAAAAHSHTIPAPADDPLALAPS